MSCELEAELTAYVDGELDEVTKHKVAAHLPGCAACTQTLALLNRVVAQLRAAPAEQVSPQLRRTVLARIEVPTFADRVRGFFRPLVLVPAGALAAGLIVAVVVTHRPGPELNVETLQDPVQLELAQNLEELDDLDVVGLEDPDDLDVIEHLPELEAMP